VHPTTAALLLAAARLAEGLLRAQAAVRDLARPGAVLSLDGQVLAADPPDWLPPRVGLPTTGDRWPCPAAPRPC